jgi:hypothetical protein
VREIMVTPLAQAAGMSKTLHETVIAVQQLQPESEEGGVSALDVGQVLGLDKSTALRRQLVELALSHN